MSCVSSLIMPMFGILGSQWLLYLLSFMSADLSVLISLGGEHCYASLCFEAVDDTCALLFSL